VQQVLCAAGSVLCTTPAVLHRPCARIHALCALRLPACCSHSSLLLPRRAATRSQLVSKQPLALPAGSACARVPARNSTKDVAPQAVWKRAVCSRSSAEKLHPRARRMSLRSTVYRGNSKGNSANAVACAPLYPHATATAKQPTAHTSSARAQAARAGQCTCHIQCKGAGSRPSGSGEGGGDLFVARMGRLFFAPSKKFLNFSSASPAHCSPHSRTLQPTTAPATAPTAAGHTGGIGHRGMA